MPPGAPGFKRSGFATVIKTKQNKTFSDIYFLFPNLPATTQMLSLSFRGAGGRVLSAPNNRDKSKGK